MQIAVRAALGAMGYGSQVAANAAALGGVLLLCKRTPIPYTGEWAAGGCMAQVSAPPRLRRGRPLPGCACPLFSSTLACCRRLACHCTGRLCRCRSHPAAAAPLGRGLLQPHPRLPHSAQLPGAGSCAANEPPLGPHLLEPGSGGCRCAVLARCWGGAASNHHQTPSQWPSPHLPSSPPPPSVAVAGDHQKEVRSSHARLHAAALRAAAQAGRPLVPTLGVSASVVPVSCFNAVCCPGGAGVWKVG